MVMGDRVKDREGVLARVGSYYMGFWIIGRGAGKLGKCCLW